MPSLHWLSLKNVSIHQQLQWEEALLRLDGRSWCISNWGSPATLVMGISAKEHEVFDMELLNIKPLPVLRRFSGGGTVIVDEETLFLTFFIQKQHLPHIAPFPLSILQWTASLYEPLF